MYNPSNDQPPFSSDFSLPCEWPLKTLVSLVGAETNGLTSQTLAVSSNELDMRNDPSWESAKQDTVSMCPSMVYSCFPVLSPKHRITLSMPPANTLSPVSLMQTLVIGYLLAKLCVSFLVLVSNTFTRASSLALAIRLSSLLGALTAWTIAVCPLYFLRSLLASMSHTISDLSAEAVYAS